MMKLALFIGILVLIVVTVIAGAAGFIYTQTKAPKEVVKKHVIRPEVNKQINDICAGVSGQLFIAATSNEEIILGCLLPKSIQGIEL